MALSNRNGITIGSYPAGAPPATLKGSLVVSNGAWFYDAAENYYYTDLPSAPSFISHVYEGGQLMQVARYPNYDPLDPESSFRRNSTGVGYTIIDEGLPGGAGYWEGAWAVVRTANWQYQMREVIAHTEVGTLDELTLNDQYALNNVMPMDLAGQNWGYYMVNKLDQLDAPGEWYYDATNGRLYALSLTTGQAPQDVEYVSEQHGLYMTNCNTITVDGLSFMHYGETGVRPAGPGQVSHTITIRNCHFTDVMIGVRDLAEPGLPVRLIEDCTFERCLLYGVRATWLNSTIRNCIFNDIGLWSGTMGLPQPNGALTPVKGNEYGSYSAIYAQGDGVMIEGNSVVGAGNNGINFSGAGATAANNYVTKALSLVNDGAAITFDYCDGCEVRDNIVSNSIGVLWGQATNSGNNTEKTTGIYFGNHAIVNTVVEGNTVNDCGAGILIDHAPGYEGNAVSNNTVFNCKDTQILLQDLGEHGADPYQQEFDTEVNGNVLYGVGFGQACLTEFQVKATSFGGSQPLVDFGAYDLNSYFNPFSKVTLRQYIAYDVPNVTNYLPEYPQLPWTLNGWRTAPQPQDDAQSTSSPVALPIYPPEAISVLESGLVYFEDDCSSGPAGAWSTTSTPGNDGTISYRRFTDQNWIEMFQLPNMPQIVAGSGPPPAGEVRPGTYRVTIALRGQGIDALQLGMYWDATGATWSQGHYEAPFAHIPVLQTWATHELYVEIEDRTPYDRMIMAIQHVQRSLGAVSSSYQVDIDHICVDRVAIDPVIAEAYVNNNHILRYHAPLPGTEADPQNVFANGGSFELIGCWSDVYGTIHSGTVTLAPWQSIVLYRLEDVFDIDVAQYNVQGNEVWTTDKKVRGSIVIANERSLTIDGATISFADSRQDEEVLTNIVVEAGGTLELINGAHLTTLPTCGANSMWDGVKNYGNVDPSAPQGMVRVHSGSRISNSLTGILGGEGDPLDPGYAGPIKNGLIDIRDAFFENNRYDVVLHGLPSGAFFLNYWDVPFFQSTTFSTTAHLNYDDLDPVAHVRVADHGQSIFLGCTFANDLPTHTQSHRMGLGIQGLNANIAVWGTGPGSSVFRNLDHAIHNMASAGAPYTNVVLSEFVDNICAVYMADVPGFAIRGNTVQMGRWSVDMSGNLDEFYWDNNHRGFFTTGSNAFSIMDNSLSRSPGNTTLLEGIVVGYTGAENDVVFRNSATDLDAAFVGEGECADVNGDPSLQGLQFQCNTNTDNAVNIKSRPANGATQTDQLTHTIRSRQGTPAYSASNTFDGAMHFEVTTQAQALEYLEYSHAGGDAPVTYTLPNPNDLDADYLVPVQVSTGITCGTGEPVWIAGGGHTFTEVKPQLSASKYEYGNLRYLYDQLIDGGSTDEVVEEITSAWPQDVWDLRTYLLGLSPNLSVEALKELVNKAYVPVAVKAEILIANPDATKKEGFLKWAELEANYPIPGYVADAIEASWDTKTYRTTLEESIADKHTRLTQLAAHAIYLLQTDTVPPPPDSLRWVWQQVRSNRARYSEAALLLGLGDHAGAQAIVEAMPAEREPKAPEEQERQRMLTYISVLRTAADDGRNHYQLTSAEVTELETMVGTHYDRPSNWASNLLCAAYGKCRAPYTGDVPISKANRTRERSTELTPVDASAYGLQPNPARNWVAFNFDHGQQGVEDGRIDVRALDGRLIVSIPTNGMQGQRLWDTRGIAPGTYVIQFLRGGVIAHTEKLIIQQ